MSYTYRCIVLRISLSNKVIGFRFEHVMCDSLHTVMLGVGAHILGNIIWE